MQTSCAVLVSPGQFKLKNSLHLPNGVHLYGGCSTAAQVAPVARTMLIAPDGGYPAIILQQTSNNYTGLDGFYLIGTNALNHALRDLPAPANSSPGTSPIVQGGALYDATTGHWYAAAQPSAVLYARSSTFSLRNVRIVAGNGGNGAKGPAGANGSDASLAQYLTQRPTMTENNPNLYMCGHNARSEEIGFGSVQLQNVDWDVHRTPWSPHESPSGGDGSKPPAATWTSGAGGAGGFEGGASFGLLLFGSHLTADRVEVIKGRGGNGGDGGDGGNSLPVNFQPGRFPLLETGAGGGGAGGWHGPSIGLVLDATSSVTETSELDVSGDFLLWSLDSSSHGGAQGKQRDANCQVEPPGADGPAYSRTSVDRLKIVVAVK